ncbi:hypothetical protein [Pseudoduganella lurida]|nr:hypothetical protein [Pseudoduganella lurida]
MKALLRTLLLWFLLAGIPFQGFASATMLFCGPQPAPPAAPAMPMPDGPHDHAAMLAAQAHEASTHHDSGTGHSHAKCASAAACCAGAALAPALPAAPSLPAGHSVTIPFVAMAPAAVDLAGPERPPRQSRA